MFAKGREFATERANSDALQQGVLHRHEAHLRDARTDLLHKRAAIRCGKNTRVKWFQLRGDCQAKAASCGMPKVRRLPKEAQGSRSNEALAS